TDFLTTTPVVMPAPDSAAASAIIANALQESRTKVPANLEQQLRTRWRTRPLNNKDTLAALYQGVAAAAVLKNNQQVMTWSYAMSASLVPNATYLSDLAYALTYQNKL